MLRQSSSKNLQQRQQELGNLSRRLQSRIGELDLICGQLQTRKEKVRSELKSPLLSVLDGGKGLKRLFAKVVSQEKMRREERNLSQTQFFGILGIIMEHYNAHTPQQSCTQVLQKSRIHLKSCEFFFHCVLPALEAPVCSLSRKGGGDFCDTVRLWSFLPKTSLHISTCLLYGAAMKQRMRQKRGECDRIHESEGYVTQQIANNVDLSSL